MLLLVIGGFPLTLKSLPSMETINVIPYLPYLNLSLYEISIPVQAHFLVSFYLLKLANKTNLAHQVIYGKVLVSCASTG